MALSKHSRYLAQQYCINSTTTNFDVTGILSGTPFDFSSIIDGNNVEISGFFDSTGVLIATRVELKDVSLSLLAAASLN